MLHTFKKNFARIKQPLLNNNVPNGEFSDLRQRLSSIKVALKYTLSMLNSANRIWVLQIQQQRQFSEKFHEAYPTTEDDTFLVAKYFADESQALYESFLRDNISSRPSPTNSRANARDDRNRRNNTDSNPMVVYNHILLEIRRYVAEIEGVEATYGKLLEARSETQRYQSKLDTINQSTPNTVRPNRRPVDESKRQRNIQKLDTAREHYRTRLNETVTRQKSVYMKHSVVFKAALTAYWLSHQKHVTALVHSLEKTQAFATAYETQMRDLDIASLSEDQIRNLRSIDTTLVFQHPEIDTTLRKVELKKEKTDTGVDTDSSRKLPPKSLATQRSAGQSQKSLLPVKGLLSEQDRENDNTLFNDAQSSFTSPSNETRNADPVTTVWSPVSGAASASQSPVMVKKNSLEEALSANEPTSRATEAN